MAQMQAEPELVVQLLGAQLQQQRVVPLDARREVAVDATCVLDDGIPRSERALLLRRLGRRGLVLDRQGSRVHPDTAREHERDEDGRNLTAASHASLRVRLTRRSTRPTSARPGGGGGELTMRWSRRPVNDGGTRAGAPSL